MSNAESPLEPPLLYLKFFDVNVINVGSAILLVPIVQSRRHQRCAIGRDTYRTSAKRRDELSPAYRSPSHRPTLRARGRNVWSLRRGSPRRHRASMSASPRTLRLPPAGPPHPIHGGVGTGFERPTSLATTSVPSTATH